VSGCRVVASGIDSLYLSGRASVPDIIWRLLADRKAEAQSSDGPAPTDLAGESVGVAPNGLNRYAYRLEHRYGFVGLSPSGSLPTIRFQPRAEFLHGLGPHAMVEWFDAWMRAAFGTVSLSVARVDLFADVTGWRVVAADRERFLTRASLRSTYEDGDAWTGFEFGRHKGGNVMTRVYDKTRQIEQERKAWWRDIWGSNVGQEDLVTRVEVEFGRAALHTFNIDTPADLFAKLGDLWRYGTHDWITLRTPANDTTKARWPIAPEWQVIQRAGLDLPAVGVGRTYAARNQAEYEALLPALTGYVSAVAARRDATDLDGALRVVRRAILDYEQHSDVRFEARLNHKRWQQSVS
jgi:hypothetical protein